MCNRTLHTRLQAYSILLWTTFWVVVLVYVVPVSALQALLQVEIETSMAYFLSSYVSVKFYVDLPEIVSSMKIFDRGLS
jgi:hypothetical protein